MTRILLDTDIGSSLDDAIALAWLLASPDVELIGITTVTGEPRERARLASVLTGIAGRELPIVPGSAEPIRGETLQPEAMHRSRLHVWRHSAEFPRQTATEFLAESLRGPASGAVLLGIGPATNLARLLRSAADAFARASAIVLMAGRWANRSDLPLVEWNARNDAEGLHSLLQQDLVPVHVVGMEHGMDLTMSGAEFSARAQHPLLAPVIDWSSVPGHYRDVLHFHDPLAAVAAVHSQVLRWGRARPTVRTSKPLAGLTRAWWNEDSPYFDLRDIRDDPVADGWGLPGPGIHLAMEVNPEEFWEHLFAPFRAR